MKWGSQEHADSWDDHVWHVLFIKTCCFLVKTCESPHWPFYKKKKSWTFSKGSPQVPEGIHSFCFDFATFFLSILRAQSLKAFKVHSAFFQTDASPGSCPCVIRSLHPRIEPKNEPISFHIIHFATFSKYKYIQIPREFCFCGSMWQLFIQFYPRLSKQYLWQYVAVVFFYEMGWGNRPWKKMGSSLRLSLYIKVVPRFNRSFYNWTMSFYRHFFCFYGMPFQPYFTSHPNSVYKMEVFQQVHFI